MVDVDSEPGSVTATNVPRIELNGPGWLFVPADRPERFAKAAAVSDQVVIDLEDGVRKADKGKARSLLRRSGFSPVRACLRINGLSTAHAEQDLELAREMGFGSIMVPMAESHQPFSQLADFSVIALVETARGVVDSDRIAAHPDVDALALGTADLQLDLGAHATAGTAGVFEDLLAYARATLLFAGRAHHLPVIDSVHTTVADYAGLRRAAAVASAYGMDGKLAIHPKQIEIIRTEFTPSESEVAWASAVVSEAESRAAGAFVLDGEIIDEVIIRKAERLLSQVK
ncbi:HpcH/HpaI aldolase/citrate lyase family protein [Brevibacterium spongiae]|uniref:CoA ester lyase n=1 Tax=Brevibacterium spongiae TaxID=2909672 RepID=A0ABY5STG7_9MICO|nr:CoA ester lyase [Brevibacterium spongiae]UVI36321.1 CoA ester lyase [Brevibacterium spongiae]